MPKIALKDKKELVSVRLSTRMIERVKRDGESKGLQFAEYVRVALLKMLEGRK